MTEKTSVSTKLTFVIITLVSLMPIAFKVNGVSDMITMAVIAIFGAIGVSFDIMNFKHTQLKMENAPSADAGNELPK